MEFKQVKIKLSAILTSLLIYVCLPAYSQTLDSLLRVLKLQKEDTNKVNTLNETAWEYTYTDLAKAKSYCKEAVKLSTKLKFIKGRSSIYNTLGSISSDEGKTDAALKYYFLSIKDKEAVKDKKGIATVYNNIGIIYRIKGQYDSTGKYYFMSLHIREFLKDKRGIGDCLNNLGNLCRDQNKYEEALSYYERSLSVRTEINDKRGIAFVYNNIGGLYDDRAEWNRALEYHYKAAEILRQIKDDNSLLRVYGNIGLLNERLKNHRDAIKYYKEAILIGERTGSKNYCAAIYEYAGAVYLTLKELPNAKKYFEKALTLALESGDKETQSHIYSSLGLYSEQTHNIKQAEIDFNKSLELSRATGNKRDIAQSLNKLSAFYCKQKKNEPVLLALNESILLARQNNFKGKLKEAYKIYATFYEENIPDLKKSIQYHKMYEEIGDSLYSEGQTQRFAEQQTKYETEKKESELKTLRQQEEINKLKIDEQQISLQKRNLFLITSGLIILLILLSGYFYFSNQKIKSLRAKEIAIRETEEGERMRLAKDIHDDLGSGLSKIKFLSEIISTKANQNPDVQASIKSISQTSVFLVENMRDLIWALNPENTTLEGLVARIREYSSDYLGDFPIELVLDIEENFLNRKITKEAHRNIFFILKECLQNLVKHADASEVTLKINVSKDAFQLTIMDNGKGLTEKINEKGHGLKNIRQRAETIGGKADITSQPGNGLIVNVGVSLKNIEKA